MKVLVLMPYLYETAPSQRFRIEQWARILEPLGVRFHFAPFESPELKRLWCKRSYRVQQLRELIRCIHRRVRAVAAIDKGFDVAFLHRELLPLGPPVLEQVLARKVPIVYDFDDAIFLPDVREANRWRGWLKWSGKAKTICRLSAHVIVGNRYLEEYARQHTERVSIVPTTIDTNSYTPKDSVERRGRAVIGWSGSDTTVKHLKTVERALQTLRKTRDFRLKVVGSEGFLVAGVEVESKDWNARSEIDDLKSFDIGIMPLPDDVWSRGKCGLKALQYMAVGLPTIASPVGVNSEIIEDGENGFIAHSDQQWVDRLSLLLSDNGLRRRFAKAGRRTVEERYSAKVQAPRVLEILQRVRRTSDRS